MINKNLILSLLAIILFTTCKKENKAEIDITGTYSLYSVGGATGTLYSVESAPCLADNMLILSRDGRSMAFYKGTSPCHPSPGVTIGTRDTITSNWKKIGDKVYFNDKQNGEIATVDGKLQLTIRDTIVTPGGGGGIIVDTFKQQ